MSLPSDHHGGHASARDITVWDPLVRLIHWSLALAILLNATVVDEESQLHEWIGFVALGLVGLRLVWALIGPAHARFSAFPPSSARAIRHVGAVLRGDRTVHLSHNPLGALMVYNLWLTVIALGVTGYLMTTVRFFGNDWLEELHELAYGWLVLSVALHVAGVMLDARRSGVNLLRAMISGRKRIPTGARVE
ncbi:cytochrome b/b6 domain-containing protein [Sedimentitalea sp. HM32M-2]|uniref:cytochrome b/b6 domain-containing protein n=1 Tax=Sedimentitalea sp. HM32M-2 TaxID=3351566 RepID=UPI0036252785